MKKKISKLIFGCADGRLEFMSEAINEIHDKINEIIDVINGDAGDKEDD